VVGALTLRSHFWRYRYSLLSASDRRGVEEDIKG
jgi:hypothetical protein